MNTSITEQRFIDRLMQALVSAPTYPDSDAPAAPDRALDAAPTLSPVHN